MTTESIKLTTFAAMLRSYNTFIGGVDELVAELESSRRGIEDLASSVGFVSDALPDVREMRETAETNRAWCNGIYEILREDGGTAHANIVRHGLVRLGVSGFDSDEDRDMAAEDRVGGADYRFRNRIEGIEAELEKLREQSVWSLEAKELERQLEDELKRWRNGSEGDDWGDDRESALLGIKLAHARTLNAELDMRANGPHYSPITGELVPGGITPNNTRYYDAQYALEEVYLDEENRATIEALAEEFDMPPSLLAGVVAAELDFDYDWYNHVRDQADTPLLTPIGDDNRLVGRLDNSQGPANVHKHTLEVAIAYLEEHKDEIPAWEGAQDYPVDNDVYRTSFEGSVHGAAIVTAMYDHMYGGAETPEEQAVVWSAYRGGVQGEADRAGQTSGGNFASRDDFQHGAGNGAPADFPGGANAEMSTAMFEFLDEQYADGRHPGSDERPPPQEGPPPAGTTTTTESGRANDGSNDSPTTTTPGQTESGTTTTTTGPQRDHGPTTTTRP